MSIQSAYQIIPHNQPIDIPSDVAVCPICGSALVAYVDEWEEPEGCLSDKEWIAGDCGFHLQCATEPEIGNNFDTDDYDNWFSSHYSMPYVDWLPLTERLRAWVNSRYRFDMSTTWISPAAAELISPKASADTYPPGKVPLTIITDDPLAPDSETLARLIYLANSRPEDEWRKEFYRLKDALLETYGIREEQIDLQHIVKTCWDCNGKGYFEHIDDDDCCDSYCSRCGGTGVYAKYWVILERWGLGGRLFHRPGKSIGRDEVAKILAETPPANRFDGLLEHRDVPPSIKWLAYLTLTYIYNPALYESAMHDLYYANRLQAVVRNYRKPDADSQYLSTRVVDEKTA